MTENNSEFGNVEDAPQVNAHDDLDDADNKDNIGEEVTANEHGEETDRADEVHDFAKENERGNNSNE